MVAIVIVAMHATRTFYPPAGIDPLIVVVHDMPWSFLLVPVAVGGGLPAAFAWLRHDLIDRGE